MRRFETLLFDLDGTLTDPADGFTRCIAHALEVVGLPPVARTRIESRIGPPLEDTFRALGADEDRVDTLVDAYRERYREKGIFENALYPSIPEVLEELATDGAILHVATSKPTIFAQKILEHFGIDRFFSGVFGSNLDGTRTHKREILQHARSETGFASERAAMVGDRRYDVEAARDLGIHALGVLWGYGSRDEIVAAGANQVVSRPGDLIEALR